MNLEDFLNYIEKEKFVKGGSEYHKFMHKISQESIKITSHLNSGYHEPCEIRTIMSELIGKDIDDGFNLFPPFFSDFGKNIKFGKNVFVNSGCSFQDQGGITIGDGTLIGHNVVLATINHSKNQKNRADMYLYPINIGKLSLL